MLGNNRYSIVLHQVSLDYPQLTENADKIFINFCYFLPSAGQEPEVLPGARVDSDEDSWGETKTMQLRGHGSRSSQPAMHLLLVNWLPLPDASKSAQDQKVFS